MSILSPQNSKNVENLSYEDFRGKERSIFHEKYDFYCTTKELQAREGYGGTALLLGATLEKLDPTDKRAILTNGSEIKYESLKMAEYLAPNHEKLSIADQRYIFQIRNRMTEIENNFPNKYPKNLCVCGERESQEHIYSCENLNQNKIKVEFKNNDS